MQSSTLEKKKPAFTYLIIVIIFLLLAWIVWIFFDLKIKESESKKNKPLAIIDSRF